MAEYLKVSKVIDFLTMRAEEAQADFEENGGESGIYAECLQDVIQDIANIPDVGVEVIHKPTKSEFRRMAIQKGYVPAGTARWLDGRCTRCGWEEPWEGALFCSMCGARMSGGDDDA